MVNAQPLFSREMVDRAGMTPERAAKFRQTGERRVLRDDWSHLAIVIYIKPNGTVLVDDFGVLCRKCDGKGCPDCENRGVLLA